MEYVSSIKGIRTMNHTPHAYIEAGFAYEKGTKPAQTLRTMLESETIEDQAEARQLIEKGRVEARQI
jgi:hypothetical protein